MWKIQNGEVQSSRSGWGCGGHEQCRGAWAQEHGRTQPEAAAFRLDEAPVPLPRMPGLERSSCNTSVQGGSTRKRTSEEWRQHWRDSGNYLAAHKSTLHSKTTATTAMTSNRSDRGSSPLT
jgi:hypothetical protein